MSRQADIDRSKWMQETTGANMKCCGGKGHHAKTNPAAEYVGMTEADAVAAVQKNGLTPRIRMRDGQAFMGTMDYCLDRVNLTVEGGKVTAATIG
jgi:hypothetical protein